MQRVVFEWYAFLPRAFCSQLALYKTSSSSESKRRASAASFLAFTESLLITTHSQLCAEAPQGRAPIDTALRAEAVQATGFCCGDSQNRRKTNQTKC
eukprot:1206481-Amphidinium_carterae.2